MAANYILGVFLVSIICCVGAKPVAKPCPEDVYKQEHCIYMTPDRVTEINDIVGKISDYIDDLQLKYKHYDIRFMKFAIERHSPDEIEDKDLKIQVVINDCTGTIPPGTEVVTTNVIVTPVDNNQGANPLVKPEIMWLDVGEDNELLNLIQSKRSRKKPLLVYVLGPQITTIV